MPLNDAMRDVIGALNDSLPDWQMRIDLNTFDIEDSRHCLLGQLYPNVDYSIMRFSDLYGDRGYAPGYSSAFAAYNDEWKAYLKKYQRQRKTAVDDAADSIPAVTNVDKVAQIISTLEGLTYKQINESDSTLDSILKLLGK